MLPAMKSFVKKHEWKRGILNDGVDVILSLLLICFMHFTYSSIQN